MGAELASRSLLSGGHSELETQHKDVRRNFKKLPLTAKWFKPFEKIGPVDPEIAFEWAKKTSARYIAHRASLMGGLN